MGAWITNRLTMIFLALLFTVPVDLLVSTAFTGTFYGHFMVNDSISLLKTTPKPLYLLLSNTPPSIIISKPDATRRGTPEVPPQQDARATVV